MEASRQGAEQVSLDRSAGDTSQPWVSRLGEHGQACLARPAIA